MSLLTETTQIRSKDTAQAAYARRQAVNSMVQGSAGDLVKTAMLHVDAALRQRALDCSIVLQVHDELVVECSTAGEPLHHARALVVVLLLTAADAAEVAELLRANMSGAMSLTVPLPVTVKAGPSLGSLASLAPLAR